MGILRDRLSSSDGQLYLSAGAKPVAEIVAWVEGGGVVGAKGGTIAPVDLIAALAAEALGDDSSLGPALVQAKPRRPKLARALSEPALTAMYPSAPHPLRLALAAGLLQVHDFWEGSHDAAQQADDRGERVTSAYWHGIAHRREPDAGNAAYWFRRVGRHPVFVPLAEAAKPLFEAEGLASLATQLIPKDAWNASAMTELCTTAKVGSPQERLARRIQRLEMWLLLEASFGAM